MARRVGVTVVVMAGGRGERLWPLVRSATPKVCLAPDGERNLLALTIERLRPVWPDLAWLVVTSAAQAEAVRTALPASLRQAVLIEPDAKNTAACITLAAVAVAAHEPGRVLVVVPADHGIGRVPVFQQAMRSAIRAAVAYDAIATIGIHPTHPHAGLGYLRAGEAVPGMGAPRVWWLDRFIEKPSVARARALLRQPRTFWNSGMFIGTADKFLEVVSEWLPEHARRLVPLARTLRRTRHGAIRMTAAFARQARQAYRALDAVSFDQGVMRHLQDAVVVEGRFPWADLGSWDVWARMANNRSRTLTVDSRNVTVIAHDHHLIATIGVKDLVIVHTPSATLVCRADRAQAVRQLVKRLAADPRLASYR
jgi:mannose-1-phosphate guanylyltransferase/mannose-6-phosphate isomerase